VTRAGWRWRLAVTVVLVTGVTSGSLVGQDPWWPFAPMSQYAFSVDLDGEIRSTFVEADTVDGDTVRVPFGNDGIGIGRAEVEEQLDRLVADPSLLQGIAEAHANRLPEQPPYSVVRLMQRVSQLDDGREVARRDVVRAAWRVRNPQSLR
jgi:hypothetical protein